MSYKDMQEYIDILNMGYVDITNIYKSNKETLAFQHKSEVGREPKTGDIRYIIQHKSGYIRNPIYRDGHWNMNGRILDTFESNDRDVGVKLLSLKLKIANGLLKQSDTYKIRAEMKSKALIKFTFDGYNSYNYRTFIDMINDPGVYISGILEMIDNPKKIYQGIIKLAKEFGV